MWYNVNIWGFWVVLVFQLFHKFEINSNQKVQNLAKENDFFFFNEKNVHLTALCSRTDR